jgi:hypothetical protein
MGKVMQVRTLIVEDLHLTDDQLEFARLPSQGIKVELIEGSSSQVLLERSGAGFYKSTTPAEVAELLKPHF